MPILTPTAATGARSAPREMTYVDPTRTMPPEERDAFLEGTSLNGPFVADLLSDMMAHERAGARLYRSVAERTNNPVLKQRYTQFGKETTDHVGILETLVTELGGDPVRQPRGAGHREVRHRPGGVDVHAVRLGRPHDPGAGHARRRAAGRGQGPGQLGVPGGDGRGPARRRGARRVPDRRRRGRGAGGRAPEVGAGHALPDDLAAGDERPDHVARHEGRGDGRPDPVAVRATRGYTRRGARRPSFISMASRTQAGPSGCSASKLRACGRPRRSGR